MNTMIICHSEHHGNTERIASVMAKVLGAPLLKPPEVDINTFEEYSLIGFGSGIYFAKHHKSLLELVNSLPGMNKKAFIFSTTGGPGARFFHRRLRKKLLQRGFRLIGEFSCRGLDTWGPWRVIGGIHKGRPNNRDLEQAETFARRLRRDG